MLTLTLQSILQTIVCRTMMITLPKLFYKHKESGLLRIEEAFGIILQKHRTSSNISQEKLALNSGLDRTYISLLERGKRKPTINTIFSLSSTLNIRPTVLIQEVEELILNSN